MGKEITLKGRVASKGDGQITGIARIINDASDLLKIQAGDIMVAPQTDINFVPSLSLCVGLITERGGRFCHAAIYSRENNLPCITNVTDARSQIIENVTITINTIHNTITQQIIS